MNSLKEVDKQLMEVFHYQERKFKELFNKRYWQTSENIRFMVCVEYLQAKTLRGLPVNQISTYIKTRTPTQVRSHAQKYFINQTKKSTEVQKRVKEILERDRNYLKQLFETKTTNKHN